MPTDTNGIGRFQRLKQTAALALAWERVWPPFAFAGAVIALFAAVSWFGLWFEAPPVLRIVGVAAFALALFVALLPLIWVGRPTETEILSRLDRDALVLHRPASAHDDALANDVDNPTTRALWLLHKARMAEQTARLSVAIPAPNVAKRDPYALRFAVVLLALVGALFAGSERFARLAAAFYGMPQLSAAVEARVDAWIDPPAYTGKPPIFLKLSGAEATRTITAPEDSALVVRADPKYVDVRISGGISAAPEKTHDERRYVIHGDGDATILQGASTAAHIEIKVAARTAPKIRLLDPPQGNISGSLTLHYAIEDAYGAREAGGAVEFAKPNASAAKHMLVGPPTLALRLPDGAHGTGEAKSTVDLSEHPWAGARIVLTLKTESVSGASATSPPVETQLPQRQFTNPLARALIEGRRDLVLDPDRNRARLGRLLDALLLGPDVFQPRPNVFLGLQSARKMLALAHNDDDLRDVAAWLWTLALTIENGDASRALKDLRSAEDKLRDALRKGASPEELKKLTQELREAAQRYLAEMMRKGDKQAMQDSEPMDSQDLEAMLNRLDQDARNGAKEDAQAMLDRLQEMMENLRSADNQKADPSTKQMRQSLRDLDKLLKDQQALRDDTFRQDQRERSDTTPGEDEKTSPKLEERQKALRERLEDVERQLRGAGVDAPKNFDEAQGDMSEAQKDLKGEEGAGKSKRRYGHTAKGDAVEEQGKAIEALRKGGQAMQQQMRGKGKGKGGYVGMSGAQRGDKDDPLGRSRDGQTGQAEGELSGGADRAERARRVLEELRRRLADPNRSNEERDYLERLIGEP